MRLHLAPVALVAALTLAACGGDDNGSSGSSDEPADVLAAAIEKSSSADSYRARVGVDIQDQERVKVAGEITSNADSSRAIGDMKFTQGSEPAVDMKMLTVDGKQYIQAPGLTGELPEGKRWVQTPDAPTGTLTPKQFMDLLRESDDIEDKGNETIGGTETVQLGGPLDLAKMAEFTDNAALKQQIEKGGDDLDKLDATIDVWIDEQADQIKRMSLSMKADGKQLLTSDAEMLEYGVSLDEVKAPPAGEVVVQGG